VAELSVIRRAPHVATLIAEGDVRTLHIGCGDGHRTRRKSCLNVRISRPSPADIGTRRRLAHPVACCQAASEAAVAEP
jgi:hypothetical protein